MKAALHPLRARSAEQAARASFAASVPRAAWPKALAALLLSGALAACSEAPPGAPAARTSAGTPAVDAGVAAAAIASAPGAGPAAGSTAPADAQTIERGRLLAVQGNCAGCHTARGGAAYAGGDGIPTPFGTVFAGNLTPDVATGLGGWTADDFWRAVHEGRGHDGRPLTPVFPYPAYTHLSRADSDALWAYLQRLPPIAQANRAQALRFPYGTRAALEVWRWVNFQPGDAVADAQRWAALGPSAARGAYLVNGLGHCAECHAPRNRWGAAGPQALGARMPMGDWYAPSLHPLPGETLERAERVALLRHGQTARNSVLGPMAAVVRGSLQHWPEADLRAVVDYLATLPTHTPKSATDSTGAREAAPSAGPDPADPAAPAAQLYRTHCADCHGAAGQGAPGAYPALAGNASVLQPDVRNLVQVLRFGGFAPTTAGNPRPYGMPPHRLSDEEMAAVLTHIRRSWGNQAPAVSALEVLQARR